VRWTSERCARTGSDEPAAGPPQQRPAGRRSQPAGPGGGVAVIDVTEATFQSEVVERSLTTRSCSTSGPMVRAVQAASPVLENSPRGRRSWVLAKIDVDANPRIAQALRVQGIPMVFAVVGGQPIDAFTGVLPESQLRQWIDAVLKAGGVEVESPRIPRSTAADTR
jgi:putative thioredoxin